MRLNNYISSTGLCSRREADKLIEQGKSYCKWKKSTNRPNCRRRGYG